MGLYLKEQSLPGSRSLHCHFPVPEFRISELVLTRFTRKFYLILSHTTTIENVLPSVHGRDTTMRQTDRGREEGRGCSSRGNGNRATVKTVFYHPAGTSSPITNSTTHTHRSLAVRHATPPTLYLAIPTKCLTLTLT